MNLPALETHTITGWPALIIIVLILTVIVVGVITIGRAIGRKAKDVVKD